MLLGSTKWKNRLGYAPRFDRKDVNKNIWLHASSMGEVKVLGILKEYLEKTDNSLSIFITVMTEAGYQSARQYITSRNQLAYLPFDSPPAVNRFLKRMKPHAAVFIETEIWPNILSKLGKMNIPIFLANGRLSEKSCNSYIYFRRPLTQLFKNYKCLMVQSENNKRRYIKIGAEADKIEVIGNLKFDAPANIISHEQREKIKEGFPFSEEARIFIAGSTRKNENEIILRVYKQLNEKFPDLKLILVPRHLEKVHETEKLAIKYEIPYCLYTMGNDSGQELSAVVIDKMGLLNQLYSISDIAFVGGTLADIGGQNILEPVWAGIPVLYGPSIYNVKDSSEYILENRFGAMVQDANELHDKLVLFFKGELTYNRKKETLPENSRAEKTARIILENI
jgi:3-deoxy-D-manno-octulosonic-acid transferase